MIMEKFERKPEGMSSDVVVSSPEMCKLCPNVSDVR